MKCKFPHGFERIVNVISETEHSVEIKFTDHAAPSEGCTGPGQFTMYQMNVPHSWLQELE